MKNLNPTSINYKYKISRYYMANHPKGRFIVKLLHVDENSSCLLSCCKRIKSKKSYRKQMLYPTNEVFFFGLNDLVPINNKIITKLTTNKKFK